jgi:hypothetical protein
MSAAANLKAVLERLRAAAERAGRAPESVRLIAVSKKQPSSALREVYAAGQRDFGENYAQELAAKAEELLDLRDVRWHVIGHLQRNKAKLVAPLASRVHTLDSLELALELERRFAIARSEPSARLPVLIEVSIAGEAQKSGVSPQGLGALIDAVERLPHLQLEGLMCMPPLAESARAARPYFDALAELRERHGGALRLPELSMGMSQDFEEAVAAGATWVRVGTAIFGARESIPGASANAVGDEP